MSDYWKNLERDEEGRWIEDDIPNQKENKVATRKTKDETDQEKAVDQREIQLPDSADSDANSTAGSGSDDTTTTPDGHVQDSTGDPHASDSDLPAYTGIDGEAFPDRAEPINSDQTETTENVYGTEYEQPLFRAVRSVEHATVGISLYGWVGPEAIVIPEDKLSDFKAFVASL